MKKIILMIVIVLMPTLSFAKSIEEDIGAFGLGYVLGGMQIEYLLQRTTTQSFHFALASNTFWDGSLGDEKSEQLWNYGREVEATG